MVSLTTLCRRVAFGRGKCHWRRRGAPRRRTHDSRNLSVLERKSSNRLPSVPWSSTATPCWTETCSRRRLQRVQTLINVRVRGRSHSTDDSCQIIVTTELAGCHDAATESLLEGTPQRDPRKSHLGQLPTTRTLSSSSMRTNPRHHEKMMGE
jgi:hypothetical protein